MRRFPWLAPVPVLASVLVAAQVAFGYWAYLAYKHGQLGPCAPGYPNCISIRLARAQPPLEHVPVWVIVVIWLGADLALLILGLWLLARRDTRAGVAWGKGALWRGGALVTAALAIQLVLGYWFVMAYTHGPKHSCNPHPNPATRGTDTFDRAVACRALMKEQNTLEAFPYTAIFFIWAGADMGLLFIADRWIRRQRVNGLVLEAEALLTRDA